MNKLKKCFTWYRIYSKRLLRKVSFVVLLCLIPAIIPMINAAMSGESGIMKVVLASEDNSPEAREIIASLLADDSIIRFIAADSAETAVESVKKHEVDAAWIFGADLDARIREYASSDNKKPFVRAIVRENSIPLQISNEMLYGAIYSKLSYAIYRNFMYSDVVSVSEYPEEVLKEVYDNNQRTGSIIDMQYLDSAPVKTSSNYLTAPMRGILSLVIVLCALAAALYFLQDQQQNKYAWLPPGKRLIPAFTLCLAASVFAAAAVFAAVMLTGLSVGFVHELVSMALYVLCSTAFALVLCTLFRSPGKLGASIPGLIIIMLALSPIFFNLKVLKPIRLLLPSHYYLYSIYDTRYFLYAAYYCAVMYPAALVLNLLRNRKPQ